ncbi:MAG: hypothetical protein ABI878_01610 [Acidobacteriota bacterium]
MFDRFFDVLDYIFPVYVIERDEIMVIDDRRPTARMVYSLLASLTVIIVAGWAWWSKAVIPDAFALSVFAAILAATLYFCVRGNYRETYVFNRSKDIYIFTRRSIIKKDVTEGAASQFRAAEVIRQVSYDDNGYENFAYRAALLQQPGLLFGTDETLILRENAPIYNSRGAEAKIARAIATFLNITNNQEVESIRPLAGPFGV